jgi:hypothetical protein
MDLPGDGICQIKNPEEAYLIQEQGAGPVVFMMLARACHRCLGSSVNTSDEVRQVSL